MFFKMVSWKNIVRKLSEPQKSKETFSQYLLLSKEAQLTLKSQPGYYIIGEFRNNIRHNAEFIRRATVTLDIDYPSGDFRDRLKKTFGQYEYFWHTSRKSSPKKPRIRVHLPLAQDVTSADEYEALARLLAKWWLFDEVDRVSFVPAQMMFFPSVCSDGVFEFGENKGEWLDPAVVLFENYIDWQERYEWPRSLNEAPPETRRDKAESPLKKPGVIGAWCRAFSITRCLEEIIPGVYEPGGEGRWRYANSEGGTGAVVYDDDTALYSHHTNHDPVAGRSVNAFDLVRVHKFGALDKDADEDLTPTQLPSFIEMRGFAMTFREVIDELDRTDAYEDFEDEEPDLPSETTDGLDDPNLDDDLDSSSSSKKVALSRGDDDSLDEGLTARSARVRSELRNRLADTEDADDLEDSVLPAIIGAGLSPTSETELLAVLAERHKELTGRKLNMTALRKSAETIRRKMIARESPGELEETDLPIDLRRDEQGNLLNSVDNIIVYLEAGLANYKIGYDEFTSTEMLSADGDDGSWIAFKDTDYTRLRRALERYGFKSFGGGNELIRQAVALIAEENTFDSAQVWLRNLHWDGVPRVEKFFTTYFGVKDSPYCRAVGRYVWSAMAARVEVPGEKADMMPVLFGKQGARKTSAIRAMVPAHEFHVRIAFRSRDDDTLRKMRGKLIAEVPELRGMASADEEGIKAFLDETHDTWVPKFKEQPRTVGRRLIFVGTIDKPEFLSDIAGNRRYLPLAVKRADVEGITRDRDQLWAEAACIFALDGVDFSAETLAAEAHREHTVTDSWDEKIEAWLASPSDVAEFDADEDDLDAVVAEPPLNGATVFTVTDVLERALAMSVAQVDKAKEMRVAKILSRLGYERGTHWCPRLKRVRKAWKAMEL